jgi:hypothetical protein
MGIEIIKTIIPDPESLDTMTRRYPNEPAADLYELAQTDTLLRLTKARDVDELLRMARAGLLEYVIAAHNEMAGRSALS